MRYKTAGVDCEQARVTPLHMGGPNAGEFTLVGVPADQLLNRYTRQRGTDIGVLSDDLLTIVLFAVGDIKTSGDVRAPGLRALPHVLACRQVCSRWRALSARPVVAARRHEDAATVKPRAVAAQRAAPSSAGMTSAAAGEVPGDVAGGVDRASHW